MVRARSVRPDHQYDPYQLSRFGFADQFDPQVRTDPEVAPNTARTQPVQASYGASGGSTRETVDSEFVRWNHRLPIRS